MMKLRRFIVSGKTCINQIQRHHHPLWDQALLRWTEVKRKTEIVFGAHECHILWTEEERSHDGVGLH